MFAAGAEAERELLACIAATGEVSAAVGTAATAAGGAVAVPVSQHRLQTQNYCCCMFSQSHLCSFINASFPNVNCHILKHSSKCALFIYQTRKGASTSCYFFPENHCVGLPLFKKGPIIPLNSNIILTFLKLHQQKQLKIGQLVIPKLLHCTYAV